MGFQDRVAVVTGAARGIGAAIAERLAREGAQVVVADLDEGEARAEAERIGKAAGRAMGLRLDVSDPASARSLVETVVGRTGRLDILVNNAGIAGVVSNVVDYPEGEWRKVMAVDLDGVFYCTKAALPPMLRARYGRIVNIASIAGKEGNPTMAAYAAAKAGVIGFTKALGKELAQSGVLVNAITPAVIETEILKQVTEEAVSYMLAKIPMGRAGQPEEVAALASWLASEECSFSTGAVFDLSGGRATY
jgi:NAD(P)-dependent dehydrogenase (short-subunit alcohol dehydrogenase family)